MDISKLGMIKKNLFEALENKTVETDEFQNKHYAWFVDEEQGSIEEQYIDNLIGLILRSSSKNKLNLTEDEINYLISNDVAYHTSKLSVIKKFLYNNLMRRAGAVKRVKPFKNRLGYEFIDYNGNKLEFSLLSKKCPHIFEVYPYLTDFEKRGGDCHPHSVCVSQMLSNEQVYVVTGNIPALKAPYGFLHSWIELVADSGTTVVLDFNYNACFDKDDYYKLKKPTVLSRIPKEDIKKLYFDYDIASHSVFSKIPMKETLLFFYELLEYFETHYLPKTKEDNQSQPI